MSAIELQHIIKNFKTPTSDVEVLKDVSFSAEPGSLSLVLGPSGSGKSTFLTIAGGIQTPTSGVVTTAGQELDKLSGKARDALRLDKIGFVLQSYNLVPYLTVGEQFTLVDKIKPKNNLSHDELDQLLDDLGIGDLVNQRDKAIVVVTHDVRLEKFADRTFTLLDGQLSEGDTSNAA